MKFSLRALLLFTAALAVVMASLNYPSPYLGDFFYTAGMLAIAISAIAAIYLRGPQRAYCVGFLILFAGYFCQTVWPSEVRGNLLAMNRFGGVGYPTQGPLSTRSLALLYEGLHGDSRPTSASFFLFGSRNRGTDAKVAHYIAFQTIGHTAISLLLGVMGGTLAHKFAQHSLTAREQSAPENVP